MDNIITPATLSVSCVYYDTDIEIFEKTLQSIVDAILHAKSELSLGYCELHLINNNIDKSEIFLKTIENFKCTITKIIVHNGHGNIGYGRANNLAILQTICKYHLILNPDVISTIDAIKIGISYLELNQDVALIAPHVINSNGNIEYLAKRMPSVLVIVLRGLNNQYLNNIFKYKLDTYAYKDKIPTTQPMEIELASGCFMLCQTKILKTVGGFSNKYFLYFEDFSLSKKMNHFGKLIHLPNLKIIHYGGKTSKKGVKHVIFFLISAFKFLTTKA